ncbi:uncharacterized protein N7487_000733 [Penicillium crustosum]|uniref:uncharacterized protein n=1 Tax=Penicillium crustosum TaxID=36656 RepID=UPI002390294D|nr:uncharacterized protein N7487_000733 [Penicillium crustosum]KAJ5417183.1 hypothetical protein N7487_000733 [Penicillium crustosum]
MAASRSTSSKLNHVHLNGRTLEGGGQLVRIAIGLSALTGRPVSIDHVRGNREGKKGLKRSHAAAVKLLAEISGSKVSGGEVGSQSLNFFPQSTRSKSGPLLDLSRVNVKSEYDIKLTTAGAIFLVFQALYPYLLHVGSQASAPFVKVNITGGTNATYSPSYDYASQVIVPNFAKLGLPPLSIILNKRGWTTGPVDLGAIDITVLAPDQPTLNADAEEGTGSTLRQFIEQVTRRTLRREMKKLDPSIFAKRSNSALSEGDSLSKLSAKNALVPITIHTSEATTHRSHVYILLVAHTSSGFRIGHDILGSMGGDRLSKPKNKGKQKQQPARDPRRDSQNSQNEIAFSAAADLVRRCVDGFIGEISNESPNAQPDQKSDSNVKRSCLDSYMRDQIVVFEALGEACSAGGHDAETTDTETLEDERDWTLHTKTAQWVCRQILNV